MHQVHLARNLLEAALDYRKGDRVEIALATLSRLLGGPRHSQDEVAEGVGTGLGARLHPGSWCRAAG